MLFFGFKSTFQILFPEEFRDMGDFFTDVGKCFIKFFSAFLPML